MWNVNHKFPLRPLEQVSDVAAFRRSDRSKLLDSTLMLDPSRHASQRFGAVELAAG